VADLSIKVFQSTRSHGARRNFLPFLDQRGMFQSTRSHGARPVIIAQKLGTTVVSIHALAWSATLSIKKVYMRRFVSIHALAWSATNS